MRYSVRYRRSTRSILRGYGCLRYLRRGLQAFPGSGCDSGTVIFRNTGETGTAIVDSRFSVLILPGESGFATMNNEKMNTLRPLQGAGRKLFVETYGCQMNVGDTEIVVAIMQQEAMSIPTRSRSGCRSDQYLFDPR